MITRATPARRRRRLNRRVNLFLVLCLSITWALLPQRAWAACGPTDPGACMDNALYQGELMLMAFLWDINQTILLLARNIEALREWLVTDVLGTAFDAVAAGIQFPFWIAAAIAWLLFVIGYFLQAIVDGLSWVNLKRLIKYAGLAMFLFQIGSQAMSVTEQLRVSVGQGFATIAGSSTSSTTKKLDFYATNDSSMDSPHTIYGDNSCPGMETKRATSGMYLNDYTANYLWADAKDIHCPAKAEGRVDVPVEFGNRYAPPPMQIDNEYPSDRQAKMIKAWDGVSRMGWGIILAIGAVVEQIMHLLFALALASTWLGLLVALLFALFVPTEGMFKSQVDGIITTLRVSWLASFWMGLALSVLNLAAQSGNGLIVGGIGILTLALAIWQVKTASQTFMSAMNGMSGLMGNAPSAVGGALKGIAGGPLGIAAGAAGALMGAGGAVMGAKDAYNTYNEAREKGLERWQALDHAQNAWQQRSINPLSRWRNEHRRERQMVREKLGDERMALQVAELKARYQSPSETLEETMNEAADHNWADSRSYATPTTGPTTPLDPTVALAAKTAAAAPQRRAKAQPTTSHMRRCNNCQQELSEQELQNHICSATAQADDLHTAETQPLRPIVVPQAMAQPTAPSTSASTAGTPAASAGGGSAVSEAQVVVVQIPPATPQAMGEDPAIQELLRHAREEAAEDHTESDGVPERTELVVAPSPSLALGTPESVQQDADQRKRPSAEAAPVKGTGVPVESAGSTKPPTQRGEMTTSTPSTADTVKRPPTQGHEGLSPVPAVQATTSPVIDTHPKNSGVGAVVPTPQQGSIAPQPVPVPSTPGANVGGTPAASPATNGTLSAPESKSKPQRASTAPVVIPGTAAQPNPTAATTATDTMLGAGTTTSRPSVSINSLPSQAVQVPVPPAPVVDAPRTGTQNGNGTPTPVSVTSNNAVVSGSTHGAAMPKLETPVVASPTQTVQDVQRQHVATPVMPAPTAHTVPAAPNVSTPEVVPSTPARPSTPTMGPASPSVAVPVNGPTSVPVSAPVSSEDVSSSQPVVVSPPNQPHADVQPTQEARRSVPMRPVPTPAAPQTPTPMSGSTAAITQGAPSEELAPVGVRGERERPWKRAQRRLAEPVQRVPQSMSEKKGRSV